MEKLFIKSDKDFIIEHGAVKVYENGQPIKSITPKHFRAKRVASTVYLYEQYRYKFIRVVLSRNDVVKLYEEIMALESVECEIHEDDDLPF